MKLYRNGNSFFSSSGKAVHLSATARDKILMLDAGADEDGRCKIKNWHRWVGPNGKTTYEIPVWKKVGKRKKYI